MSTVNKHIADSIIAGEFPEDECIAIIRYENAFDGNYAYKCIFSHGCLNSDTLVKHILNTMISIATNAPVKIYWCENWIEEKLINSGFIDSSYFLNEEERKGNYV